MIIDAHIHTLCPGVNPMVARRPELRSIPYDRDMAPESAAVEPAQFPGSSRRFLDIAARREDMTRIRVDDQLVMPAPGRRHYWAEPDLLAALSCAQNEHVAGLVADGARPRARRSCASRGGTGPQRLSDRYAHRRDGTLRSRAPSVLGAALALHLFGVSDGARLGRFFMLNTVGNPLEEVIAANHLALGGVLDRHPELRRLTAEPRAGLPEWGDGREANGTDGGDRTRLDAAMHKAVTKGGEACQAGAPLPRHAELAPPFHRALRHGLRHQAPLCRHRGIEGRLARRRRAGTVPPFRIERAPVTRISTPPRSCLSECTVITFCLEGLG